jgi:hypothetical protein
MLTTIGAASCYLFFKNDCNPIEIDNCPSVIAFFTIAGGAICCCTTSCCYGFYNLHKFN